MPILKPRLANYPFHKRKGTLDPKISYKRALSFFSSWGFVAVGMFFDKFCSYAKFIKKKSSISVNTRQQKTREQLFPRSFPKKFFSYTIPPGQAVCPVRCIRSWSACGRKCAHRQNDKQIQNAP